MFEAKKKNSSPFTKMRDSITHEDLLAYAHYDPQTGMFTWRVYMNGRAIAGARAGCLRSDGYVVIRIKGEGYLAHRLAWFYVHGQWPDELIDHINGDPSDNRIVNLRAATFQQNMFNRPVMRDAQSGSKGVSRDKSVKSRPWVARMTVTVNGEKKTFSLGHFATRREASAAYAKAAKEHHGEYAQW